jgi:hypothetical protein
MPLCISRERSYSTYDTEKNMNAEIRDMLFIYYYGHKIICNKWSVGRNKVMVLRWLSYMT